MVRTPAKAIVFQVLVVVVLAMVVRALHFHQMRHSLVYEVLICDAWQYDHWARQIDSGQWLGTKVFYQTPLYPYFLAVLYAVFGHHIWVVRCVQALMSAASCAFVARAGARLFSERVGWLAGILLALYPPAIFFDGILQKASLDLLLMTSLLWVLAAGQSRPGRWPWATAGILLGLLILNRENAAILFPILIAWVLSVHWGRSWGVRGIRTLQFTVGVALVLVPVGLRNLHVGGEFLLTTSQMGPNFYIGNHRGASGRYESLRPYRGDPRHESDDARALAQEALGRPLLPAQVSRYWLARAWTDIQGDFEGWLRLLGWKAFLTFHSIEVVDAESIRNHQEVSAILSSLGLPLRFGVLVSLTILGLWWTRREWRRIWILYAMVLAFAFAVTLFYTMARYRYPLVPILAILASCGVMGLADLLRPGNPKALRELLTGLGLALPAAVVCNWPLPASMYADEVTYVNMGTALLDLDRAKDAIGPLKRAEKINPSFAATCNNLGLASQAIGDLAQARHYYERAIQLEPNLGAGYFNLGHVCLKQGDRSQGIAHLRKALELDPLQTQALRALARLELSRGSAAEGLRYLRRAVEVEPESAAVRADLGMALLGQRQPADGVRELRAALSLDRTSTEVANNLAWVLATCFDASIRRSAEALELATEICGKTDYKEPAMLDTLAAAYAEAGQFGQAVKTARQAIDLASRDGKRPLAAQIEERLRLYASGRPFHEAAP